MHLLESGKSRLGHMIWRSGKSCHIWHQKFHLPKSRFVAFYNGRQNTGSAYANGFWFTCPGVGNGWVSCEVVASNEATCPDNKELWYDTHHGVNFEYAVNWRTGSSCNRGQFSGVMRPVYAPAAGEVYDKGFNSANGNFFRIKHDLNNNGN